MRRRDRMSAGFALIAVAAATMMFAPAANAKVPVKFKTMAGYPSPGTPANLNVVGVLKTGDPKAKNVLVLNPGTSASAAYFEPLAKGIVKDLPNWQIWAVERRENFLEDQSELNLLKQGKVSPTDFFNYYLGYLSNPGVTKHLNPVPDSAVPFARQWGMNTEINDLRVVVKAAAKGGRNVAMGGHSLGGSITTAYATWDFNGRPGAKDLSGLVYIDGGSSPAPVTAAQATQSLQSLQSSSPWLSFGGIPAPFAGVFSATGSCAAIYDRTGPSLGYSFPALPANLKPPLPAGVVPTNEAQYGFAVDNDTSPASLAAAQGHVGHLATSGSPRSWIDDEITPIQRFAAMFCGKGLNGLDGTAWYHPQRLTIDAGAVAAGNANPAQSVLNVKAVHGDDLRRRTRIYAFGAALGGDRVLAAAQILAQQSGIPASHLTRVNRQSTYSHNDPSSASPHNAFVDNLIPYLAKVAKQRHHRH
jgi:pimeloyl-ACP methyl ester carboxylesterase